MGLRKYDFSSGDSAIIRSYWDFYEKLDEFLNKLKRISKQTKLINTYDTVTKYSNKLYLNELEEIDIPIIPSKFINEISEIEDALNR